MFKNGLGDLGCLYDFANLLFIILLSMLWSMSYKQLIRFKERPIIFYWLIVFEVFNFLLLELLLWDPIAELCSTYVLLVFWRFIYESILSYSLIWCKNDGLSFLLVVIVSILAMPISNFLSVTSCLSIAYGLFLNENSEPSCAWLAFPELKEVIRCKLC